MRLLVFGSRTWGELPRDRGWGPADYAKAQAERAYLAKTLDRVFMVWRDLCVIEGEARGPDRQSRAWAENRGVAVDRYPVSDEEWRMLGKKAGHLRNERMHRDGKPDEAIGFISGKVGTPFSRGSASMVAICRREGTPLTIYREDGIEVLP